MRYACLTLFLFFSWSLWSQFDLDWIKEFNVNAIPQNGLAMDNFGNSYTFLDYKPDDGAEFGGLTKGEKRTNDMVTIAKTSAKGQLEWHLTIDGAKEIPAGY